MARLGEEGTYSATTTVDCCLYTNHSMDRPTNSVGREKRGAPSVSTC